MVPSKRVPLKGSFQGSIGVLEGFRVWGFGFGLGLPLKSSCSGSFYDSSRDRSTGVRVLAGLGGFGL